MRDAMDVAEYVLWYCENKLNKPITNLQLQKFLYYIQGANILVNKTPLFDNTIEAWKYGPVVPDVYYWYNNNLSNDIKGVQVKSNDIFSSDEIMVIERVSNLLINVEAWTLVKETHNESPWKNAYNMNYNEEIDINSIREFFTDNEVGVWSKFQRIN